MRACFSSVAPGARVRGTSCAASFHHERRAFVAQAEPIHLGIRLLQQEIRLCGVLQKALVAFLVLEDHEVSKGNQVRFERRDPAHEVGQLCEVVPFQCPRDRELGRRDSGTRLRISW